MNNEHVSLTRTDDSVIVEGLPEFASVFLMKTGIFFEFKSLGLNVQTITDNPKQIVFKCIGNTSPILVEMCARHSLGIPAPLRGIVVYVVSEASAFVDDASAESVIEPVGKAFYTIEDAVAWAYSRYMEALRENNSMKPEGERGESDYDFSDVLAKVKSLLTDEHPFDLFSIDDNLWKHWVISTSAI